MPAGSRSWVAALWAMNRHVHPSSTASIVPGAGTEVVEIWGSSVRMDGYLGTTRKLQNDLRGAWCHWYRSIYTWITIRFIFPDRATRAATTRCFDACRDRFPELRRVPMSEDIIVLGGLAGVFCWTYILLPLIYRLGWSCCDVEGARIDSCVIRGRSRASRYCLRWPWYWRTNVGFDLHPHLVERFAGPRSAFWRGRRRFGRSTKETPARRRARQAAAPRPDWRLSKIAESAPNAVSVGPKDRTWLRRHNTSPTLPVDQRLRWSGVLSRENAL